MVLTIKRLNYKVSIIWCKNKSKRRWLFYPILCFEVLWALLSDGAVPTEFSTLQLFVLWVSFYNNVGFCGNFFRPILVRQIAHFMSHFATDFQLWIPILVLHVGCFIWLPYFHSKSSPPILVIIVYLLFAIYNRIYSFCYKYISNTQILEGVFSRFISFPHRWK